MCIRHYAGIGDRGRGTTSAFKQPKSPGMKGFMEVHLSIPQIGNIRPSRAMQG